MMLLGKTWVKMSMTMSALPFSFHASLPEAAAGVSIGSLRSD
jgi:hypothetical protein